MRAGGRRALRAIAAFCTGACMAGPAAAVAQTGNTLQPVSAVPAMQSDSVIAFLADARRHADRYRDRRAAIAEGFRQIGPDMPGMGEHWMQPGRMVSGRFNVAEPAVLTYITVQGEPMLTGVAYVLPLQPGQAAPAFPEPHAWHEHGGTVDEELLVALGPHGMHALQASGMRLGMLHAWVFVDNPDGAFAGDNWGLPFVRLGLRPPLAPDVNAAHALSLVTGGTAYYANLFRLTRMLTAEEEADADRILARAQPRVARLVARSAGGELDDVAFHGLLAAEWHALWRDLALVLSPSARTAIARFGPGSS